MVQHLKENVFWNEEGKINIIVEIFPKIRINFLIIWVDGQMPAVAVRQNSIQSSGRLTGVWRVGSLSVSALYVSVYV